MTEPTPWLAARDLIFSTLSSGILWIGVGVGVLLAVTACAVAARRRYRARSITVSLPFGLGNVTYETSSDDRVIAWKMYVQLTTRKAALPFDEAHDLVADVYSSLYELFPVTRELLSGMQIDDIARAKGVADVILRALNDGLRPHLTQWNARYRSWWEQQTKEKADNTGTPQEVQRRYPMYEDLVKDLKRTNTELSKFADELLAIARADRPEPARARPPQAPPTCAVPGEHVGETLEPSRERGVEMPSTPYDSALNATETKTQ